jgi:hypothetical protein
VSSPPVRHVLVVADSLAFHGPKRDELLTDPRLYPNVMAAALSTPESPVQADVVARVGWTARDAWWALTRDPMVYSVLLPRAWAVVLAVGNMDYLPTSVPTWLREGIRFLRPPVVRRGVRAAYQRTQPHLAGVTPWRALSQRLTDEYLSRCVCGVRYYHPGVPVIGVLPPPHRAPSYGAEFGAQPAETPSGSAALSGIALSGVALSGVALTGIALSGVAPDGAVAPDGEVPHDRAPRGHARAVGAARAWGRRQRVPMIDLPALVGPHLAAGRANPDGMHFGWESHEAVGGALAAAIRKAWMSSVSLSEPAPPR